MTSTTSSLSHVPINIDNVEERLIVCVMADTSYSMKGNPIAELKNGLRIFKEHLDGDELLQSKIEFLLIIFGGRVSILNEFATIDEFEPPDLTANGETPMGQAILTALQKIEERKAVYRSNDIDYYRPIIIMFTDGAPTDTDTGIQLLMNWLRQLWIKKFIFKLLVSRMLI